MEPVVETTNPTRDILIALGVTLLIIAVACIIIFWPSKKSPVPVTSSPVPSSPVPSTPVTVTLSVLNGSGVVGAAGTAAEKLKSAGFEVTNIGNADRSNYKRTKITSKNSVDPKILEALGKTADKVDFATGSGDMVEIILGKDL